MNAFDNLTMTVICIYFKSVSKHWRYLFDFMVIVGITSFCILIFFVPESPKWLLLRGKQSEAIVVFNKIAAINGG